MSTTPPLGFLFSACTAGLKASGKPDLACALIPDGAAAAAMFTRNQVVAAPVTVGRDHLNKSKGMMHAVIVNAGNANCATGKPGIKAARLVCQQAAQELNKVRPEQVFLLPPGSSACRCRWRKSPTRFRSSSPARATPEALDAFANAIITTDTHKKISCQSVIHNGKTVTLCGVAKGAGMIHPNMATMLVYLFTDVVATPRELQISLEAAVDYSFNLGCQCATDF